MPPPLPLVEWKLPLLCTPIGAMRLSIGKWIVAPGDNANTPGDFFWCATLVANDE